MLHQPAERQDPNRSGHLLPKSVPLAFLQLCIHFHWWGQQGGGAGSGTQPASLMAGPSPRRRPSQARPGWLLGTESGCQLRRGWFGRVQVQDQAAAPGAWGWAGGCAVLKSHPLCLRLWVSFTLWPLLSPHPGWRPARGQGSRAPASGVGAGLWELAWEALPWGPYVPARPGPPRSPAPPWALGHLTTARPGGSGPHRLQVASLVLAEASPLSAGS